MLRTFLIWLAHKIERHYWLIDSRAAVARRKMQTLCERRYVL